MSDSKNVSVTVGPGAGVFLFAVFLVLKVTGYIDWSWWLVTLPLWIGFAILLVIGVFVGLFALVASALDKRDRKRRRRALAERRGYGNPSRRN